MTLIFAALISTPLLTKVAIFGAVACGAWFLLELMAKSAPRAEQRLEEFRDPSRRRGEAAGGRGVTKRSDGMARLLEKASPRMAKPLQPKTEEEVGKLRAKLNYAGFRGESASSIFLGLKTVCLGVGFVLAIAVARLVETVHSLTDVVGGVTTGLVVTLGAASAITRWPRRVHLQAPSGASSRSTTPGSISETRLWVPGRTSARYRGSVSPPPPRW